MGKKKQKQTTVSNPKATDNTASTIDRRSSVRISDVVEENIKQLLQNETFQKLWTQETVRNLTEKRATSRLLNVYKSLLEYGFIHDQVQQSIKNLPRGCVSLNVALDWLMFNTPVHELPKCFTTHDAVFSTKNMIDVVKAAATTTATATDVAEKTSFPQHPAQIKPLIHKKKDNPLEKEENSKAWIMQYMTELSDEGSSRSDEIDEMDNKPQNEEWAVWSDQREVDRRRRERKKRNKDVKLKISAILEEMKKVRVAADDAKLAGNGAKQKQAGLMIHALKEELAELEAAHGLPVGKTFAEEQHSAETVKKEDRSSPDFEPSIGDCQMFEEIEPAADEPPLEISQSLLSQKPLIDKTKESDVELSGGLFADDNDWEGDAMGSLFDETSKPELIPPSKSSTSLPPEGREINIALEKYRKGNTSVKTDHQRLPKYILTQNCQKQKWGNPSFTKIASSQFLQSVSITVPNRGKKGTAAAVESGVHTIAMPLEYHPGSVQEAQHCVAIAALMKLFPHLNLDFVFQQPYRDVHYQLKQYKTEKTFDNEMERFIEEVVKEGGYQKRDEAEESGHVISANSTIQTDPSQLNNAATQIRFLKRVSKTDQRLKRELEMFQSSESGQNWMQERSALPVHAIRKAFLETLERSSSIVVMGDTGCGKTTQIPQFIYEQAVRSDQGSTCNILITQPRRLAAVAVAHRVAEEMGQPRPESQRRRPQGRSRDAPMGLVGYHVRLDAAVGKDTRLTFCTTGILLRLLSGDPLLSSVSCVIVDEVHERTMHSDFLLAILKDLIQIRMQMDHPLKVVLMSATLDVNMFSEYLACPQLFTSGRTYPVQVSHLEHIYERIQYRIDPEGDAALRSRGHNKAVRTNIQQKASSTTEKRLIEANWGDDSASAELILNKSYDEQRYADFSETTKQCLQIVNEERIDYDLLEQLIVHIDKKEEEGAILVFLPGIYEINKLYDRLTGQRQFSQDWIIRLHSSLTPEEQSRAFAIPPVHSAESSQLSKATLGDYLNKQLGASIEVESAIDVPSKRVRKVVIATNIAETSLTISDVVFVIDSGKLRERQFDATRGISSLVEGWISQASAKQRQGRAGRVRDGFAFRLFTQHRYETKMETFQVPEIMRMPLEEIILQIHALKLGRSGQFLVTLPQPPDAKAIESAVMNLQQIGALESDVEELTPLGQILATLPIDARIGKLLVYASYFDCLPAALTLAAAMGERSIFITSPDTQTRLQQIKRRLSTSGSGTIAMGQQSDHLVIVAAFHGWMQLRRSRKWSEARRYIADNLLREATLETTYELRIQFAEILVQAKLIRDTDNIWNVKADDVLMIRALLTASMYPNICTLEQTESGSLHSSDNRLQWKDGRNQIEVHRSSVNADLTPADFHYPFMAYLEKVKTHGLILRDCTVVSPISLLLFGGSLHVKHKENSIIIDNRIRIKAAAPVAVMFKKLRMALDDLILKKIDNPESISTVEDQLLDIIKTLLIDEEHARRKRL